MFVCGFNKQPETRSLQAEKVKLLLPLIWLFLRMKKGKESEDKGPVEKRHNRVCPKHLHWAEHWRFRGLAELIFVGSSIGVGSWSSKLSSDCKFPFCKHYYLNVRKKPKKWLCSRESRSKIKLVAGEKIKKKRKKRERGGKALAQK